MALLYIQGRRRLEPHLIVYTSHYSNPSVLLHIRSNIVESHIPQTGSYSYDRTFIVFNLKRSQISASGQLPYIVSTAKAPVFLCDCTLTWLESQVELSAEVQTHRRTSFCHNSVYQALLRGDDAAGLLHPAPAAGCQHG